MSHQASKENLSPLQKIINILSPPKELHLRGRCSAHINGTQIISFPEILTNPETQEKYCNCPHKRASKSCRLSPNVIAKAEVQKR